MAQTKARLMSTPLKGSYLAPIGSDPLPPMAELGQDGQEPNPTALLSSLRNCYTYRVAVFAPLAAAAGAVRLLLPTCVQQAIIAGRKRVPS